MLSWNCWTTLNITSCVFRCWIHVNGKLNQHLPGPGLFSEYQIYANKHQLLKGAALPMIFAIFRMWKWRQRHEVIHLRSYSSIFTPCYLAYHPLHAPFACLTPVKKTPSSVPLTDMTPEAEQCKNHESACLSSRTTSWGLCGIWILLSPKTLN